MRLLLYPVRVGVSRFFAAENVSLRPARSIKTLEGVGMTLEQELIEIFASTPAERNREILIGYYGWNDGRQHTLTEIGARFGVTRERVRQVCAKLTKRARIPSAGATPGLDRALALIASRVPCPAVQIETELRQQGLTAVGMSVEGVAAGAGCWAGPARFKIVRVPGAKAQPAKTAW